MAIYDLELVVPGDRTSAFRNEAEASLVKGMDSFFFVCNIDQLTRLAVHANLSFITRKSKVVAGMTPRFSLLALTPIMILGFGASASVGEHAANGKYSPRQVEKRDSSLADQRGAKTAPKLAGSDPSPPLPQVQPPRPAANPPDVSALEADLRSTRQRLDQAGRDKAAMTQSLRVMQTVVAQAVEAMKQTGAEKAARQALEADLRAARQRLEDVLRDRAAMSQSLRAMQAAGAASSDATKRTDNDRTAYQALETELREARQRLDEAGRDKAVAVQSMHALQVDVEDRESKRKAVEAQTSALTASLAAARRDALAAARQAVDGKTANQALETDLRATRQRLEDAGREKAATAQAFRDQQAAVADREGKLKAAEGRTSALSASLTAARHDIAVASEAAKRAGDDRAANQTLEADLHATRQRLDEAVRGKAAADQALKASRDAVVDREVKLKAAEVQTSALSASLTAARRDGVIASEATKRAADEKTANQALEADLRATRQQLDDASRDKAATAQVLHALQAAGLNREDRLKAAAAETLALTASLAAARHDAAMATKASKQAGDDRTANGTLEADLRTTQQQLQDAERDKVAAAKAFRALQAAVLDREGKLKAAEAQTTVLAARLDAARRDSTQASEAIKRAADNRPANQAAEADLREMRQRLEDADREKSAATQALQATVANREGKLKAAETQTAALSESLAAARHDAKTVAEATKQTADERTANQALEADLRATRQRLDDASREKSVAAQALHVLQSSVADREGRLKAAETHAAALTENLAAARHDTARAAEATKQAAEERTAKQALEAALRATRQQLDDASREKSAAAQALHALQAAILDREVKLKATEVQTAALTASLATARRDAATASEATKQARFKQESVGRFSAEPLASAASKPDGPIESLPSNIVLRYRAGDPAARQKATVLKSSLNESGLSSSDASAAADIMPGVHVTYYYKQDQTLARQVSRSVTSSEPSQKRAGRNQMPLPGTVEVSVGG